MILLEGEIYWDETLPLEEQSEECQTLINEKMQADSVKILDEYCGRTETESWDETTYEIVRTYNYLTNHDAPNCYALGSTVITVNNL